MTWELFTLAIMIAFTCAASIVGAYWFAERAVRMTHSAWDQAQKVQDAAWDRMNNERTIWLTKMTALVDNNLKLTKLACDSAAREVSEAQRWMEVTRQGIIRDVSGVVGDKLAEHSIEMRLGPEETAKIPVLRDVVPGDEARVTPSNA